MPNKNKILVTSIYIRLSFLRELFLDRGAQVVFLDVGCEDHDDKCPRGFEVTLLLRIKKFYFEFET